LRVLQFVLQTYGHSTRTFMLNMFSKMLEKQMEASRIWSNTLVIR